MGSEVLRALRNDGIGIRGGDRAESIDWHVADLECEWILGDLHRKSNLEAMIEGAEAMIHCAGYRPSEGEEVLRAKRQGVEGLRAVLDTCLRFGLRKVVYVSAASTVQQSGGPPGEKEERERSWDENSYYLPGSSGSSYAEVKAAMEAEVYRYISKGLPVTIVNPGFVLGPGDVNMENLGFLPELLQGRPRWFPRERTNVADVRDVAGGVLGALKMGRPGRRYLLGGEEVEIEVLLKRCSEKLGREYLGTAVDPNLYGPIRQWDWWGPRSWGQRAGFRRRRGGTRDWLEVAKWSGSIESQRAEAEIGYRTRSMERTLDDMIRWIRQVGYLV